MVAQRAFYLDPLAGAVSAIGRVYPLGDDAFLPGLAHRAEQLFAGADHVLGDMERWLRLRQQRFEALLALDIGQRLEIIARQAQQVEGEIGQLCFVARLEGSLQR